jgi:hypothetical protein
MRKTEDEDKQKVDNVMALEYKKALDGKLEKGKALEALEELIEGD